MAEQVTCATCRWFGRDDEPLHGFRGNIYPCLESKKRIKDDSFLTCLTRGSATLYEYPDRPKCEHYKERQ